MLTAVDKSSLTIDVEKRSKYLLLGSPKMPNAIEVLDTLVDERFFQWTAEIHFAPYYFKWYSSDD